MLLSTLVGVFRDRSAGFAAFLEGYASPFSNEGCVARNFLLDENIPIARISAYPPFQTPPSAQALWKQIHQAYLRDRVWVDGDIFAQETEVADLPETFWDVDFGAAYKEAHEDLEVLRVESLAYIASRVELDVDRVQSIFQAHLQENSPESATNVETILHTLAIKSEDRPTFAGFAVDLAPLFGLNESEDVPGWPNRLRDMLGLIHYDPAQWGNQPIAVFKYSIKEIRKARGRAGNLLGIPSVLDGSMNPAFCPPPNGESQGFAVDLSGGVDPVMEVVHPTVRYLPSHLFRLGTIDAVPGDLQNARAFHLTALREMSGRIDYGVMTDSDIL